MWVQIPPWAFTHRAHSSTVRASALHAEGSWFESRCAHKRSEACPVANLRSCFGVQILQRPQMPFYSVKLLAKKEAAEKTTAFFFEKPKNFKFIAGQFISLYLKKNLIHDFSIASSPKEKDLMITTRMRPSVFKNSLKKLKTGNGVKIEGPFGQLSLHRSSRAKLTTGHGKNKKPPAVFLAGGIGITPFRSMLKSFPDMKITLFYSNRRKKDAAFLEELENLEKQSNNFKLITTMTREKGKHINSEMIKENVKDWRKGIYYAIGSTGFVQSMVNLLSEMKIKPEQIKTENFSGY